jgi:hypothetical protein
MTERYYLRRGFSRELPFKDSTHARNRIAVAVGIVAKSVADASSRWTELTVLGSLRDRALAVLGIEVELDFEAPAPIARWIKRAAIGELLGLLTIVYDLQASLIERGSDKPSFDKVLNSILTQENLAYRMDETGAVRDLVDEEFSENISLTLRHLVGPRYDAVGQHFLSALAAMVPGNPDWRGATRESFDACECLFKLMVPNAASLKGDLARREIGPMLQRRHNQDAEALRAGMKALDAFSAFVDGAHNYRHAKGTEVTVAMPEALGVLYFSQLASFLRWLVEIDAANAKQTNFAQPDLPSSSP